MQRYTCNEEHVLHGLAKMQLLLWDPLLSTVCSVVGPQLSDSG